MPFPTLLFLQECKNRLYVRLSQFRAYTNGRIKAENAVMEAEARKAKGYVKPKEPKYPKVPTIESGFLTFYVNLMLIKTMLTKFNYTEQWSDWDFRDVIDSAFLLMVQGYEI